MKTELSVILPDLAHDLESIRKNRDLIKAEYDRVLGLLNVVGAYRTANQALCKHPTKHGTYDGWDCPDCGASR